MSNDPILAIQENSYVFTISWYFPEDGEFGGSLGESKEDWLPERPNDDHIEAWTATQAILKLLPDAEKRWQGLVLTTATDAKKALTAARGALKALREDCSNWPAWALEAVAAGWKVPRGWKP